MNLFRALYLNKSLFSAHFEAFFMQLITPVEINSSEKKISYKSKGVFIGSCFAESIGSYLLDRKYNFCVNPFGVLYNPISVANAIKLALGIIEMEESDFVYHNGLWHSFYHHGSFSASSKAELVSNIYSANLQLKTLLINSDFLFITFGTSWVFEHCESRKVVSNNHKLPGSVFVRKRLEINEIEELWNDLIAELRIVNPLLKIVFTVSPVRHLKDGVHENQLSKSTLLLAIDVLIGKCKMGYFPSYEIVLDELRDYRFYADDLTHPSSLAIDYIAEKFMNSYCDEETKDMQQKVEGLVKAARHKPFNPQTDAHQKFIRTTLRRIDNMEQQCAELNFDAEKKLLHGQIL